MSKLTDWLRWLLGGSSPPTPPTTPPTPPPSPPVTASDAVASLDAHNRARRAEGAVPLRLDLTLTRLAQAQSDWQARSGHIGHTGEDGSDPFTRIRRSGYQGAGSENAAAGWSTFSAADAVSAWLGSTVGHRENVLDSRWRDFGAASALGRGGTRYWTAVYGAPGARSAGSMTCPQPLDTRRRS